MDRPQLTNSNDSKTARVWTTKCTSESALSTTSATSYYAYESRSRSFQYIPSLQNRTQEMGLRSVSKCILGGTVKQIRVHDKPSIIISILNPCKAFKYCNMKVPYRSRDPPKWSDNTAVGIQTLYKEPRYDSYPPLGTGSMRRGGTAGVSYMNDECCDVMALEMTIRALRLLKNVMRLPLTTRVAALKGKMIYLIMEQHTWM